MNKILQNSVAHLKSSDVTWFHSNESSSVLLSGFYLYFLLLVTGSFVALFVEDFAHGTILYSSLILSNVLAFSIQVGSVILFPKTCWPVATFHWGIQLFGVAVSGASFARSLHFESASRVWIALSMLLLQCLFTSMQFAVTLEYLHNRARAPSPRENPFVNVTTKQDVTIR